MFIHNCNIEESDFFYYKRRLLLIHNHYIGLIKNREPTSGLYIKAHSLNKNKGDSGTLMTINSKTRSPPMCLGEKHRDRLR